MPRSLGKSALKVLLGLLFIASAILKLVDMDRFELYVYSYHFFSLNLSFIAARFAIILELVLGIGLVSHCWHKLMWWGSVLMLGAYTLLLIYALYHGRTDSCHCFGAFLPLNPKQSLVKNVVLLLLFLPVFRMEDWRPRFRWLLLVLSVVTSSLVVFAVSPPDSLNTDSEQNLQVERFEAMLDEAPLDSLQLREGRQVVCFFSTGCETCRMAARKLSLMQQFYGFSEDSITYVFVGREEDIAGFYADSESAQYRNVLYPDAARLLKVVNGYLPTLVLLDNGSVLHEYGFRNMKEEEIMTFFASF